MAANRGLPGSYQPSGRNLFPAAGPASGSSAEDSISEEPASIHLPEEEGGGSGGRVNGGDFSLRLPVFLEVLIRFRQFLTLLLVRGPFQPPIAGNLPLICPENEGGSTIPTKFFPKQRQVVVRQKRAGKRHGSLPGVREFSVGRIPADVVGVLIGGSWGT